MDKRTVKAPHQKWPGLFVFRHHQGASHTHDLSRASALCGGNLFIPAASAGSAPEWFDGSGRFLPVKLRGHAGAANGSPLPWWESEGGDLKGIAMTKPRIEAVKPRIRGRTLQRIRRHHFMLHPLCVECEKRGVIRLATQLDHIVALVNGGKDFDQDEGKNRQGLCDEHHEAKTRADLGQRVKVQIGLDGWPVE